MFRHPLVRSAVYRAAAPMSEARSTAPSRRRPIRRSTRIAARGTGRRRRSMPDEDVAAELERSAARAQARGGFAAAAAFLERSSVLTLDPARRAARALAAAQAKHQAGALDEALTLLAMRGGRARWTSSSGREVDVLRARISFAADRGSEAPRAAAQRRAKARAAGRCRWRARSTSTRCPPPCSPVAWRARAVLATGGGRGACRAARAAVRRRGGPAARRVGALITDGPAAGTPTLRRGRRAPSAPTTSEPTKVCAGGGWRAGQRASSGTTRRWDSLTMRQIRAAREAGALADLPLALSTRVGVHLFGGRGRRRPRRWSRRRTRSPRRPTVASSRRTARSRSPRLRGREDELTRSGSTSTAGLHARDGEGMGSRSRSG